MLSALARLGDLTSWQWGMFTTAQAGQAGVTHMELSRLDTAGLITRIKPRVYRLTGSPEPEFEDLRAAWLAADPRTPAYDRFTHLADGITVAGYAALRLHGDYYLPLPHFDFVSPRRLQTRNTAVRFRRRQLSDHEITVVEELPVMTLERAIADVLTLVGDRSIMREVIDQARERGPLDDTALRTHLDALTGYELGRDIDRELLAADLGIDHYSRAA
ncbi:hypothetical protein FM112_11685 [Gulosibacter sp. 10]|nr:hypothetical protein FM112_11685 [Gulosibacter sp. 10]